MFHSFLNLARNCLLILAVLLVTACDTTIGNAIPTPRFGPRGNPTWITVQVLYVELLGEPTDLDGEDEFRFFIVIGGQDSTYSPGLIYPQSGNLKVHKGDVIDISGAGLAIDEAILKDQLYIYCVGIDSDEQDPNVNRGAGLILGLVSEGLSIAISGGNIIAGMVTGFILAEASAYIQREDIIGDGILVHDRASNWGVGPSHTLMSVNGNMRVTYRLTRSETKGVAPVYIPKSGSSGTGSVTGDCIAARLARVEDMPPPLSEVRGSVVTSDGQPVAGARVKNVVRGAEHAYHPEVTTDGGGNYNFAALNPQPYRVTLLSPGDGTISVDFEVREFGHRYVIEFVVGDCGSRPVASGGVSVCSGARPSKLSIGINARVDSSFVNMRSGPEVSTPSQANVVRALPRDSRVRVIDGPTCTDGVWWKVQTGDGAVGWMKESTRSVTLLVPVP